MSFKQAYSDWSKLSIENVKLLPAVQWKLQNIEKLIRDNPEKHKTLVKALENKLF